MARVLKVMAPLGRPAPFRVPPCIVLRSLTNLISKLDFYQDAAARRFSGATNS